MISIPLNLETEAKNIIEMIFIRKSITLSTSFTDNLLHNFDRNKFTQNELTYERNCHNLFIETLSEAIPLIDNMFLQSEFRLQNYYVSKKNIIRDREIYFGDLMYERNYYVDKNKKNGFYFIDELFGFEKYTRYDQLVRALFINEAVNTNGNLTSNNKILNHHTVLESLKNDFEVSKKIPRQTIYRWIKNWDIPTIEYKPIPVGPVIYVMADEKYVHKQIKKELKRKIKIGLAKYTQEEIDEFKKELKTKHYIMSKCFVIFTGKEMKNGRAQLLGRHLFVTSSKQPWKELMDEICKIYDFEKVKRINLLSDSGSWILSGKSELKLYTHNEIVVNTCEFHVKQYINRMIRDKEINELMALDVYEYEDKKDFLKLVDIVLEKRPNRKEKINGYKDYIINHWNSIINMKNCDIKSSMESHISHYVANHFGSRPKGYSDKNIEQYLKLETLKNNGVNILDLYLSSNAKENSIYNEKELNFSMFEKSSSNLPTSNSNYPVTQVLHRIAHPV